LAVVCGQALAAADWVVGVTRGCLDEACALDSTIASRSSVIYNSLPPVALAPTPLAFDPPRLLCLGRLEAQKGFDVALRALAAVRRYLPAVRLTVSGDGTQRSALEDLAAQLGLAAAVRFTGWVAPDDVPRLINEHTLVVMPSRYEPFGLVALQAAQMCRPLVASRIAGLSEVVRDGETGVLCDANDPTAFAAAIVALLRQEAVAIRMGTRAREHVQRAFCWDEQVIAYEALFRRIHAETRGSKVSGSS
jgi:glycogen(starch) synthase